MNYSIKWLPELGWAVFIGVLAFVAQVASSTDFATVAEDPWAWVGTLGVGAGRVALALMVNELRRRFLG